MPRENRVIFGALRRFNSGKFSTTIAKKKKEKNVLAFNLLCEKNLRNGETDTTNLRAPKLFRIGISKKSNLIVRSGTH